VLTPVTASRKERALADGATNRANRSEGESRASSVRAALQARRRLALCNAISRKLCNDAQRVTGSRRSACRSDDFLGLTMGEFSRNPFLRIVGWTRLSYVAPISVCFCVLGLGPAAYGESDDVSLAISRLKDKNTYVRYSAIRYLGGMKDPRAVDALIEVLKDTKSISAADSLGKIGTLAVAPLIATLKEPLAKRLTNSVQ